MQKNNMVLGLDLGTNSVGWALFKGNENKQPQELIDLGVRIFQRAVEDKTPTPKNHARRNARMARRVIQRRARRKQRMMNYLISLGLLPETLNDSKQPEIILNQLGCPYSLRTKALDLALTEHQLGRVLLHLVQRRGFQSNRKTLLGDMIDDPDTLAVLSDEEDDSVDDKEETAFKKDIALLREEIEAAQCRTLGEYLNQLPEGGVKRNRVREGGSLRTDRQMYKDEFWTIINKQKEYHPVLDEVQEELFSIIFFQRPLKLKKDRVGKCSLEKNKTRAKKAWQLFQRFRYLQDINNLKYFDSYSGDWQSLSDEDRQKLVDLFENEAKPGITKIKKILGFSRNQKLNYEAASNKSFKGNLTAISIRKVLPEWDNLNEAKKQQLENDLVSYESKKALKKRLINHWGLDKETAISLCLIEFEPEHAEVSLKAIRNLMPFLEAGQIYSTARENAGYDYKPEEIETQDILKTPPELPNPIVNKGLHELKRVINAIISEYGKPAAIRLEMARDLEMNTKRYKAFTSQQNRNTKLNEEAQQQFEGISQKNRHLGLSKYASHIDKLKYRLWLEQENRCAYSNKQISLTELFTSAVEVDHILPYSFTLNDSYMNKAVCFAAENQFKGQRTPREAFASDPHKWEQIEAAIVRWYSKGLSTKRDAFYKTSDDLDKDFIGSQLTDTRYISREAYHYLKTLGVDVSTVKGQVTSWLRHIWGMNSLIDDAKAEKDRSDHRHHAIDAAVVACTDRSLYQTVVRLAKELERQPGSLQVKDLHLDTLFENYRDQVQTRLNSLIVAHTPDRKLTGALHEDTGSGFIEGIGTVYRKNINEDTKLPEIKKIIDPEVKRLVMQHLEKHGGNPKTAFTRDNPVLHKDAKTPIKRVRILQSSTTQDKLKTSKLGIRNKQGKVFKWMTLGNTHHVEIFRHKQSGKYKSRFVTTLEATRRAHNKQPLINCRLDDEHEYFFSLHRNDLVEIVRDDKRELYRVQKFEGDTSKLTLRHHLASTLNRKDQELRKSISTLMNDFEMQPIQVNAIGKLMND